MNKANVIPNTLLVRKWQQKLYALHRERVCNPRAFFPRISPEADPVIKRHKTSLKGLKQYNKKHSSYIEPYMSQRSYSPIPVNNLKYQRAEMYRIATENVRLFKNLICKQSPYDLHKFKLDEKVRRKYVKLRCIYPISLKRTKKNQKQIRRRPNKGILTTIYDKVSMEGKILDNQRTNDKTLIYKADNWLINDKAYNIKLFTVNKSLIINVRDDNTEIEKILNEHEGICK